jgi:tyrosyl-tRNA synthetase
MSKSIGNYVGLSEDALSMYSKLEKISDAILNDYFELLTDLPLEQLPENPRDRQKLLALEVVSQYHGKEAALQAQEAAISLVQGGKTETDAVPEFSLASTQFPSKLFYLLSATGLCKSSSDARRQIQGGAVRLDGEKVREVDRTFQSPTDLAGKVLQLGKNKFVRFTF